MSTFRLFVNNQQIDEWLAADTIPTRKPDGHSATSRTIPGVALRTGDNIRIEGGAQGGERAPLDFIEILPSKPPVLP